MFFKQIFLVKLFFVNRAEKILKSKNLVFIRNFTSGKGKNDIEDFVEKHYFPGLYGFLEDEGHCPVFLPVIVD